MTLGPLRALAVALACAWLTAAPAEGQRSSLIRIGALTEAWGPTTLLVGLRDGLQELGYREDRDFSIGVRKKAFFVLQDYYRRRASSAPNGENPLASQRWSRGRGTLQ